MIVYVLVGVLIAANPSIKGNQVVKIISPEVFSSLADCEETKSLNEAILHDTGQSSLRCIKKEVFR